MSKTTPSVGSELSVKTTNILLDNSRLLIVGVMLLLLLLIGTGEVFAVEIPGGDIACENHDAPIGGGDVGQVPEKATC